MRSGFENPEPIETTKETGELKERLQKEFTGAVLKWMRTLDLNLSSLKPTMPRSRRLGAAFVPAVFFTTLIGCGDLRRIDCSDEEADLLQASMDWVSEHPKEFNSQMAELWPDQSVSAEQIIEALKSADVGCGEGNDDSSIIAGTANRYNNEILINVSGENFEDLLSGYKNNQWVEGATLNDIVEEIEASGDKETVQNEIRDFYEAVNTVSSTMVHEAAHFLLGSHSAEIKQKVKEIGAQILSGDLRASKELQFLDEIYAWGTATYWASNFIVNADFIDPTY